MATMVDIACPNNLLHANAQPSIAPPINPTQSWLNPFNIPRSEKDALIRELQKRSQSTSTPSLNFPREREFKPQPPHPSKKPRQSSRPLVPRNSVSPERARHLERNRIAANKCRLKKKREHEKIQHVLDNEEAKRDTLLAQVDCLKEEIWVLKNAIFEHAKCDDSQINLQLARMTQSVLDGPPSPMKTASPTFSTWSDGSVLEGSVGSNAAIPPEGAVYGGYPEGMVFDNFVDVPSV